MVAKCNNIWNLDRKETGGAPGDQSEPGFWVITRGHQCINREAWVTLTQPLTLQEAGDGARGTPPSSHFP
jgi:hypothetical protein